MNVLHNKINMKFVFLPETCFPLVESKLPNPISFFISASWSKSSSSKSISICCFLTEDLIFSSCLAAGLLQKIERHEVQLLERTVGSISQPVPKQKNVHGS